MKLGITLHLTLVCSACSSVQLIPDLMLGNTTSLEKVCLRHFVDLLNRPHCASFGKVENSATTFPPKKVRFKLFRFSNE